MAVRVNQAGDGVGLGKYRHFTSAAVAGAITDHGGLWLAFLVAAALAILASACGLLGLLRGNACGSDRSGTFT